MSKTKNAKKRLESQSAQEVCDMSDKDFMKLLFPAALVKKIEITEITPCLSDLQRIKFARGQIEGKGPETY